MREIAADIVVPLTKLYNLSLRTATVPDEWKRSNITPVHKSGPQNNRSNFRPISVVSIVAKILEKFVAAQLETYFETNQLLSPYQGAYRNGRSTEQILLFVTDLIVHALDNHKVVCSAFLDLRKAFDSLDHVLLLQRLNSMGIHGTEIAWFTDYLTNRL